MGRMDHCGHVFLNQRIGHNRRMGHARANTQTVFSFLYALQLSNLGHIHYGSWRLTNMLQLHEIICSPGKDPHIGAVRRQCGYDGFLVVRFNKIKGFQFSPLSHWYLVIR